MRFLSGFVTAFAVLGVAAAIAIWSGVYNFAASEPHAEVVRSVINTALRNSVAERAESLAAPGNLTEQQIHQGAREFAEYCVHCHGAPGVKPHAWTRGMLPEPPPLSRAATSWSVEEIFWIAKHGIKMTGMPAFGVTESDETIWQIAAFVKRLPEMGPQEYARLQAALGKENGGGHSHAPGKGH